MPKTKPPYPAEFRRQMVELGVRGATEQPTDLSEFGETFVLSDFLTAKASNAVLRRFQPGKLVR